MIVDHITSIKFLNLTGNFLKAVEFLANTNLAQLPDAKGVQIDGDNVYYTKETYLTKPEAECKWEAHAQYADIQIVIKGKEIFGYSNRNQTNLEVLSEYDSKKDIVFYKDIDTYTNVLLTDGMFVIAFPDDLHLPKKQADNTSTEVSKIVVKVKL